MSVKDNLKDAVSNISEVETYQKKIEGFIDVLKRHGNSNEVPSAEKGGASESSKVKDKS